MSENAKSDSTELPSAEAAVRIWVFAIKHGLVTPSVWMSRADALVAQQAQPARYLIELATEEDSANVLDALYSTPEYRMSFGNNSVPIEGDLEFGLLLYNYRRGHLTLGDLLLKAGSAADSGKGNLECEVYYALHKELEASSRNKSKVHSEVVSLLQGYLARLQDWIRKVCGFELP